MSKSTTSSDPQWIVSNREDGQNVGAWHWVEHDVLPFLQEHAIELLSASVLVENQLVLLRLQ